MSNFLLKGDIQQIVENIMDVANGFSGKKILLTGGRGFLGRYFMEIFNELNETVLTNKLKVIVLDNLITSGKEGAEIPNYKNIEFINHDVIKEFIFNEKLDFIVHAAGIASPYYYRAYPLETLGVAIEGTKNMLELAEEIKQSLYSFHHLRFMVILILKIFPQKKVIKEMFHVLDQGPVTTKAKE